MDNERFIKVNLTKKEKMNLLLFDLLPERILKEKIVYKYKREEYNCEVDELIEDKPDDFQAPAFFEDIEDSDSNF